MFSRYEANKRVMIIHIYIMDDILQVVYTAVAIGGDLGSSSASGGVVVSGDGSESGGDGGSGSRGDGGSGSRGDGGSESEGDGRRGRGRGRGLGKGGSASGGGDRRIFGYTGTHPTIDDSSGCPHCFCSPCVIANPPSFVVGRAAMNAHNAHKRYPLYRKFWRVLNELGVWRQTNTEVFKRLSLHYKESLVSLGHFTSSGKSYKIICYFTHIRTQQSNTDLSVSKMNH